jgi:purine-nucleoside phosphorylase
VLVLSGRRHAYEDGAADGMKGALRTLRALGVQVLVQTNAAGSLDAAMPTGSLMLMSDHLNLPQRSPLVGEGGSERFVDMANAYDPALREARLQQRAAAARCTKACTPGCWGRSSRPRPRSACCRLLGARAVGMSTVPETILARWLGLRVLALSLITNLAAGLSDETLSHAHTLAQAEAAGERAGALLADIVQAIARSEADMDES